MKTITKLLWGIISAAVCVMYKIEANAKCELVVNKKTYVGTTFYAAACSAMNVCGDTGAGNCQGGWQTENYLKSPDKFTYLINKYASQITGSSQICPSGYYVTNCEVANGTTYYTGVDSFFASGLCAIVNCTECPGGGTTLDSVGYNVYDEGRGFNLASGYSDWQYVCSNYDAISGVALGGVYMQQVGMSCAAEKVYELFNDINDCFLPPPVELAETPGDYTCVDATGAFESAWYK